MKSLTLKFLISSLFALVISSGAQAQEMPLGAIVSYYDCNSEQESNILANMLFNMIFF